MADNSTKKLIDISLWSLWHRRNKVVHEGVNFSKQETLGFIRGYVRELSVHTANISLFIGPAVIEFWRPPNDGTIKVNFDASFSQVTGIATTTALARNHKGEVIGGETYLVNNAVDSFVAEVRACERGLIFAHKDGVPAGGEGDALSVIKMSEAGS